MKLKVLLQAGVMLAGLLLVLITLSGTTRTIGVWLTSISIVLFLLDGFIEESTPDE